MNLIVYGPPGAGKTAVGRAIARRLGREFLDGDDWIEARWGRPVHDYFDRGDEALFREREAEACRVWAGRDDLVIAPGGGALLDPHSRARLESSGPIVCLTAPPEVLLARLNGSHPRPLLAGDPAGRLADLLKARDALYRSFAVTIETRHQSIEMVADSAIAAYRASQGVTHFALNGGGARLGHGLLSQLGEHLAAQGLRPPFLMISDANVAPLYAEAAGRRLSAPISAFPAGEAHKTLETVRGLYGAALNGDLERAGTIVAVGGGVVGDVAGFVAATLLRGVAWANLPTTVLAMVDAGLGGKVGVDLPEGKNLVGAFHPPRLVLSDFDVLRTLPEMETRCGLAEIVKSAVIGDGGLFENLSGAPEARWPIERWIVRGAAVKVGIVNADPLEKGERARLNLGHTIGHGVESASGFSLQHGQAVAIGLAAEARLAEALGLAGHGLADQIAACLRGLGLPTRAPGLAPEAIRAAMRHDKKKAAGRLRFALPAAVGDVRAGIEVDDALIDLALKELIHGR